MNCLSDNKEEKYMTTLNVSIQTDDLYDNDFFLSNLEINTQRKNKINIIQIIILWIMSLKKQNLKFLMLIHI